MVEGRVSEIVVDGRRRKRKRGLGEGETFIYLKKLKFLSGKSFLKT
jgi:phage gp45-like